VNKCSRDSFISEKGFSRTGLHDDAAAAAATCCPEVAAAGSSLSFLFGKMGGADPLWLAIHTTAE
jgi:hypothetical protein